MLAVGNAPRAITAVGLDSRPSRYRSAPYMPAPRVPPITLPRSEANCVDRAVLLLDAQSTGSNQRWNLYC